MENNDKKEVVVDPNEPKSEITEQHIESFEEFDDKKMVKALNKKGNVTYKYKKHVDMSDKIVVTKDQLKGLQVQKSPKKPKNRKGLIAALSCLAGVGVAAAVAAPLIVLKTNNVATDPALVEHKITFQSVENWTINGPTKAKKGDIVKFEVIKTISNEVKAGTNKVPDYLSVGSNKLPLTKDENKAGIWTTGNITWQFVENKTLTLTLKNETVTDKTWDVGFDLNGGTTSDQDKIYQKIQDYGKVVYPPNITSPTPTLVFDKWQISTDFGATWKDFNINSDVITAASIIKPLWKFSDKVSHTFNFFVRDDETKISGESSTIVFNYTKWKDVPKPVIQKNSYELSGWYYVDSTGNVASLGDDDTISFEKGITATIFAQWKEAKGSITFVLKDDKLQYPTPPTESYKVESGTSLKNIPRPIVNGTKDSQKVYYPNGIWLIRDPEQNGDNWETADEEFVFTSQTNIILAPDWTALELGKEVVTTVTFDAGDGTFEEDGTQVKTKTYTYTQTVTAQTTRLGSKWSEVSESAPTTINPPEGWALDTTKKWGIALKNTDLLFGDITLKANYNPVEKHTYSIQLIGGGTEGIAWEGTQFFSKEYYGPTSKEKKLKLGDLGFIKQTTVDNKTISSLNESVVKPIKENHTLINWEYFNFKDGAWKKFTENKIETTIYSSIYNSPLYELADSNGNIKIRPVFESIFAEKTIALVSGNQNIYIENGINVVKIRKDQYLKDGKLKLGDVMSNFAGNWKGPEDEILYPVDYTNMLTGEKLDFDSKITDDVIIKVHWAAAAFSPTKSLVQNLWWDTGNTITIGTPIAQCPWSRSSEIDISMMCDEVYYYGLSINDFAYYFGYDSPDDLIGLERNVEINGITHYVRVIDYQHDTIASGTNAGTKAVLTFQLSRVLCNSDGTSLKTKWDSSNNWNYLNSVLRWNLNGNGSGTKPDEKDLWSDGCALSRLPADLITDIDGYPVIKTVNKQVTTSTDSGSTYTVNTYDDKLFPLTMTEMAQKHESSSLWLEEGSPYRYWTKNEEKDSKELKNEGRMMFNLNKKTRVAYHLNSPDLRIYVPPELTISNDDVIDSRFVWRVQSTGEIRPSTTGDYLYINKGVTFAFCI